MKNKIIFGVHSSKENDLNSVRVYLAWKEEWESTKDAYNSQIFLDPELEWELDDKLQKEIPLEEINIPGGFVWDYVTLGYEVTSFDSLIDTEEVINKFKEYGFEYSPEFGDAIVKDMEENLNSCEVEIPENLKELYTKAVEIAKNWVEEKQKSEGTGYSYDQPIQKPENLWRTLTKEDLEEFGENPDFEFYYYENNIYIIVDYTYDCMLSNFGEEFQKTFLEEIISEYENPKCN